MRNKIQNTILGFLEWKTKRKIVVIESDDWGSIRVPSTEVYSFLKKKGFDMDSDPYMKYDSIATSNDLEMLFETLKSVRGRNGEYAKLTANTIMGNPDFPKIREEGFENFHVEPLIKTLNDYSGGSRLFEFWKKGMTEKVFRPQFHGREHLNIYHWLKDLKAGDKHLLEAFDQGMISISSVGCRMPFQYMEGLDFYDIDERNQKVPILMDGLRRFEKVFGYRSKSFIANCYIWHDEHEKAIRDFGVLYVQGVAFQKQPRLNKLLGHYRRKFHYIGQKNEFGQRYLVRNCFFEPSHKMYDLDSCMSRIENHFANFRPVILGSHRINFVGRIDPQNAEQNNLLLKKLLQSIIIKWPDVEFMFSDELGDLMKGEDEVG